MGLTREEIAEGLRRLGLTEGHVVLVHSAMRTFGDVDEGAEAVIAALRDVLGTGGTLVVPTFTFKHEIEDEPIIDPQTDASEMGVITERVRIRPDALRSTALRHSFAAVGPHARAITETDPRLAVFDVQSTFGVMLNLNAQVLLLGLDYHSSTSHHFSEWLCQVPYRHTIEVPLKVRKPDGTLEPLNMIDYQPHSYQGSQHSDFNRLGQILEDQGLVTVDAIGNCVARRFSLRDLVETAQQEAAKDFNVFRNIEGEADWIMSTKLGTTVMSPPMRDGAERSVRYHWCVVDPAKLKMSGQEESGPPRDMDRQVTRP